MFRWFSGWICIAPTCFYKQMWSMSHPSHQLEFRVARWCHFHPNWNNRMFMNAHAQEYRSAPRCACRYAYLHGRYNKPVHCKCKSHIRDLCTRFSRRTDMKGRTRTRHAVTPPAMYQLFVHLQSYQWRGLNISQIYKCSFFYEVLLTHIRLYNKQLWGQPDHKHECWIPLQVNQSCAKPAVDGFPIPSSGTCYYNGMGSNCPVNEPMTCTERAAFTFTVFIWSCQECPSGWTLVCCTRQTIQHFKGLDVRARDNRRVLFVC